MNLNSILLSAALLLPAAGCAVGLPRGPIEPSVTADCVNYLNENWLPAAHTSTAPSDDAYRGPASPPPAAERQASCVTCKDCPLIPNAGPQPMHVEPGPPGRFLPVPVRPAFAPRAMDYPQLGEVAW